MKLTIIVHDPDGENDRTFSLDDSALTTRKATQLEAESAYLSALVRGFHQKARDLADLGADSWARETRKEERG